MTDNNYYIYIPLPDVMVGLNSTVYNVSEDVGVVEVCAVMSMTTAQEPMMSYHYSESASR